MPPRNDRTKPASSKRASLPRRSAHSSRFLKDWKDLNNSGRFDMTRLKEAMGLLVANDAPLGPEWKDHDLMGDWKDFRECHIGGDFLLIYSVDEKKNEIIFARAGTHSQLFE